MTIHDIRLPEDIEQGAVGGPGFLTTVVAMGSGQEQRNSEWARAKQRWQIGYGIQRKTQFQAVLNFFYARRGRAYGFLFKDWSDYEAEDAHLGVGNSTTGSDGNADYQLIKTYEDAEGSYLRKITRPVSATLTVEVNGSPSVNWTLVDGGIVRFTTGFRPLTGQVVTASYEFDVPVRFNVDNMKVALIWADAGSVPDLEIVEVLE